MVWGDGRFWWRVCDAGAVCVIGVVMVVVGGDMWGVQTRDGATPLYVACEKGHQAVAGLLLDRDADVNQARVRCVGLVDRGHVVCAWGVDCDECR